MAPQHLAAETAEDGNVARGAGRAFTLLHVRGIPVRVHWTLLLMIIYLGWTLSLQFTQLAERTGGGALPPLAWGLLLATSLFIGVALHELGHSLIARLYGARVRAITLTFIGGVSEIEEVPEHGGAEAIIALAGPIVSFALAGGAFIARDLAGAAGSDIHMGLSLLARLNFVIAVFNLLPAFPLDGGRLLRALLARRQGSVRATRTAAAIGKAFAVLFAILAIFGNWLLLVIALFMWISADAELRGELAKHALRKIRTIELSQPLPIVPRLGASESIESLIASMRNRHQPIALVDLQDGVGIVDVRDLARLPQAARADGSISAIAKPLPLIDAEAPALEALRAMERRSVTLAGVTSSGELVALISQEAITRAIEIEEVATRPQRPDTQPLPPQPA